MLTEHSHLKEGSENEYETVTEDETLNSMVPLWKKPKAEVKKENLDEFLENYNLEVESI